MNNNDLEILRKLNDNVAEYLELADYKRQKTEEQKQRVDKLYNEIMNTKFDE